MVEYAVSLKRVHRPIMCEEHNKFASLAREKNKIYCNLSLFTFFLFFYFFLHFACESFGERELKFQNTYGVTLFCQAILHDELTFSFQFSHVNWEHSKMRMLKYW